jgi:hypothetical protein
MCRTGFALLQAAALMVAGLSAQSVTPADVERLQASAFEAGSDVSRLRTGDAVLRHQLELELDELREEVTYFKVKLRKGEQIRREDLVNVRDRIDDVRRRARSEVTVTGAGLGPGAAAPEVVPVVDGIELAKGTALQVRLLAPFNSLTAQARDRLEAATTEDLVVDKQVVVPAGSLVRGLVTSLPPANGQGNRLTVIFDQVVVNYRSYAIAASPVASDTLSVFDDNVAVERPAGALVRLRFDRAVTISPGTGR